MFAALERGGVACGRDFEVVTMNNGCLAACAHILVMTLLYFSGALAAERVQEFTYDDAGRLNRVISPEREVSYALDDAGNRTSLLSAQGHGWPSSILVPQLSISGDYMIEWGASTGSGTRFELFEANNAGFSKSTKLCDNCGQQWPVAGKPDGTYYYRVRACEATTPNCGPYRAGANPVLVERPPMPSVPATFSLPMYSLDGSFFMYWAASSGTVTAYELYESVNGAPFGATPLYSGLGDPGDFGYRTLTLTGRGNGAYAYRLRACNTPYSCTDYRNGSHPVLVTLPPSAPGPVSAPAYNNTGNYTVQWSAPPEQMTHFELLEKNLSQETIVYSGMATSHAVTGKPEAVLSYRVRACNGSANGPAACSAYTSEPGMAAVIYIDKVPPTPPTSLSMLGNRYSLSWSGGSEDSAGVGAGSGLDHWNIYRNGSLIGSSTGWSFDDTTQPGNVTLNYVVRTVDRAGNESADSPTYTMFRDTIPPTTPGNFRTTSVTATSVALAWDASADSSGIARYEITRTPGGVANSASTSYLDVAVSAATTYTYQVVAIDGQSVRSAPATIAVTTLPGAPAAPVLTAPTRDGNGSYVVSWTNQDTTGSVAYYVLEEMAHGSGTWVPWTVNATSYQLTGQSDGTYQYRVRACTSGGICSGYSNTRSVLVCIDGCTD